MFRLLSVLAVAALIVVGALVARPDPTFLAAELLKTRTSEAVTTKLNTLPAESPLRIVVDTSLDFDTVAEPLRAAMAERGLTDRVRVVPVGEAPPTSPVPAIHATLESTQHSATIRLANAALPQGTFRIAWYAVLPPLLAILAAIILRRVVVCLMLGIVAGGIVAVLPAGLHPAWGAWRAFYTYFLHGALLDQFRAEIISFVLLMSATVGLAQAAGGVRGVLNALTRFCRTVRAARMATCVAGLLLFFDDYLNCIIVGNTMRPLTDRFRISREKLAYIVDSTAAPVAGLALVSTWIAFEISQIDIGLRDAAIDIAPYDMFIRTVPYRFYCWFALVGVTAVCWFGRDYGPMRTAERTARDATADDASKVTRDDRSDGPPPRAINAILPIGTIVVGCFLGLWITARPGLAAEPPEPGLFHFIRSVLQHANSARAFACAGLAGFLVGLVTIGAQRLISLRQTARAVIDSVRHIMIAVVILFLAWSIGAACKDVGTATYLVAMFREVLEPVGFAAIVFGMACLVSFSTGTSYGTMAILLPNVVPLAFAVGNASALGGIALATMSIGAVLDGAIFGDHCSPISDTTILSAISSECHPIEHVRTQLPYALTAMALAMVVGYVPAAMGLPPVLSIAFGAAAAWTVVRVAGRPMPRRDLPLAEPGKAGLQ
jgi:Na+/H+ antiporter NhaC